MRLSELQHKDIIDLNGKKIGNIIDVIIDQSGKIRSLVLENNKRFLKMSREPELEIEWEKIERIGEDVILVRM